MKVTSRSSLLKIKCSTKDLKANFRSFILHLSFEMLLLVVLFTNYTSNLLLLTENYLYFKERYKQIFSTLTHLIFCDFR